MLVKVFEAEDMATALKVVKEKLGPDALILSTRTLRKGGMGVFGKPMLEVTAAVEPKPAAGLAQGLPSAGRRQLPGAVEEAPRAPMAGSGQPLAVEDEELSYRDLWKQRKVIDPLEDEIRQLKQQLDAQGFEGFREELKEIKGLVKELTSRNQELTSSPLARAGQEAAADPELAFLCAELNRCGIEGEAAEVIRRSAKKNLLGAQLQDPALLMAFFRQAVSNMVTVSGAICAPAEGQKRVALVGPTGVGKTTTIAKLAAEYLVNRSQNVALVTIDTYRIAAVEQLKVYGGIMNLSVEVVYSPEQLQEAFARHQDKDLILIDTSGRSPRDQASIEELLTFVGPGSGAELHLVLSATNRDLELRETIRRFSRLPLKHLIMTKLDECDQCGTLVNVPVSHNLPLSYVTNGQRVPEDLVVATAEVVAKYVIG